MFTFLVIGFYFEAKFSVGLKDFSVTNQRSTHCLGMNYYVNFLGDIGSNGFHIKLIFGTQDN